uniref:HintN domain-containing protein n=1 Tax=Schistosoma mansoni TaxID=6183 RepID=A0A5K4FDV9_SCHMA
MYQSHCLLFIILLTIYTVNILQGCMKSSMFYRTPIRTRSHVFVPGEYQPKQLESNLEASGPLDTRDFHNQFPNKRLVRVDSPYIIFDSEEARWMTKGCRDRLIKLSTQIHNTWAKQDVILRVIRSWVKPPPNYKPLPQDDNMEDSHEDSPLLYEKNSKPEKVSHSRNPVFVGNSPTVFSGQRALPFVPVKSRQFLDAPIIDMTPEMMDGEFIQINSHSNKIGTQSKNLKFNQFIPSSKSISTQTNRWPSIKNNPNYITHLSSLPRSYPTQNSHSYQSLSSSSSSSPPSPPPPSPTSSSSSSGYFFNPNKVSSSLPDSTYNTMIRLPRNILLKQSNIAIYHLNQTINLSNRSDKSVHKLVERSISPMYPSNTDRNYRNYDYKSNHNYLINNNNNNQLNELRMEEFHYAGRAVDMELITRKYGRPHNSDLHLGVLAQIAYYVAHFDWCFFNRAGHVHCSVKPDSIVTSQWFGCFSSESKVFKSNGQLISMKDLKIGDYIITQNPLNGHITNTLVIGFLDYDQHAWSPLIEIKYQINSDLIQQQQEQKQEKEEQQQPRKQEEEQQQRGQEKEQQQREQEEEEEEQQQQENSIYLTEDHLIFIYDNSTMVNNDHKKAVYASNVKKGQIIFVYNHKLNKLMKAKIISVQLRKSFFSLNNNNNTNNQYYKIGLYAPITDTGTMIVDNVLVSCFAYISNHQLASFIILPWKLIYKLFIFIKMFQFNEYNEMDSINSNGVPWFIQWIYKLTYRILSESHFYKSTYLI